MLSYTVKMIAYRAETAMVAILRRHLNKEEEARALIRELFVSSADIVPDPSAKTLTVKIHRMASPVHDRAVTVHSWKNSTNSASAILRQGID